MGQELEWAINPADNYVDLVLIGDISESSDFTPLLSQLREQSVVHIHLAAVRRINSSGIRQWINFIEPLSQKSQVTLFACPPVVVSQLNVISNFAGRASVQSVQAPYICEDCDIEMVHEVMLQPGIKPELPVVKCEACGEEMEFDDLEDEFFAFIES